MIKLKHLIIFITIIIFSGLAKTSCLTDLIKIALKNNIELEIERFKLKSARIDTTITKNQDIPDINLSYLTSMKGYKDSMQKSIYKSRTYNQIFALNLVQVFPGLGRINKFQKLISELKYQIQKINVLKKEKLIAKKITEIYLSIIKEKELLSVHTENLILVNKLLEVAKINYDVGLVLKNDILRIETQKSKIEEDILKTENNIRTLLLELINILNIHKKHEFPLKNFPSSLKFQLYEPYYNYYKKLLLKKDYDLILTMKNYKIFNAGLKIAKSARLPSVSINASYNYGKKIGSFLGTFKGTKDYTLSLGVQFPVYDTGDISLKIKKAEYMKKISELTILNLINQKDSILRKILSSYQNARKRIATTEKAVEQSIENMRLVITKYKHGESSIVELIDAQITLSATKISKIMAYFQERMTLANLLFLVNDFESIELLDSGGKK